MALLFDAYVRVSFLFVCHVKNWPQYFRSQDTAKQDITYRMRNGMLISVPARTTDVNPFTDVWFRKVYDAPRIRWKEARTIVDIGAHVGAFSLYAARRSPAANVYAFEPEPVSFGYLQTNVAQNHLEKRIHCAQFGIAAAEGALTLNVMPGRGEGNSLHRGGEGSTPVRIHTLRLQDAFDRLEIEHCDILKMNAEGVEYEIFYDLPAQYFARISTILMNYHIFVQHPDATPEKLRAHLERHGFFVTEQGKRFFIATKND